jgi:imidazoleglycerol-phosphate dehydratase
MNDAPEGKPINKTPPKVIKLADGTLHYCLDDGEEDNTVRPSDWFEKERQTYGTAADLLRQAADMARELALPPRNGATVPTASSLPRTATLRRETGETKIDLSLNLDGTGRPEIATGIGFFDHVLVLLAKHSLIDLTVKAEGDLHVDAHHTVEDVGICFGKALAQALGDKAGIRRYGSATLPMDETLVTAAVDLSGRPFCVWNAAVPLETLGTFNAALAEEFWRAASSSGLFNLHVVLHHGKNTHHVVEGIFKATARALRQAVELDPRMAGVVPSTKGVL